MKIVFHVCLLFCFFSAKGQTDDSLHFSKFDFGFSFSPDYSYRSLKADSSYNQMKNIYDTSEVARIAYTAGFNAIYHVNEKLFISGGLLFSDRGEKTKKYELPPVNNYVNHYYYLSIPVKANYYLLVKKVKFFICAGLAADIYLNSQSNVASGASQDKRPVALSSKVSRVNLAFNGGIGIDCPITDRWYFKLQPDYRTSVTSVANGPLKKYFHSAGIHIGFFCRLQKPQKKSQ